MRKKDVDDKATHDTRQGTSYAPRAPRSSRRPMTMRDFARVFLGEVSESLEEHTNPEMVDVPVNTPIDPDWIEREEPTPTPRPSRASRRVHMTVTELPADPNPPAVNSADAPVAVSIDPEIEAQARAVIQEAESDVDSGAHLFDVLADTGERDSSSFTEPSVPDVSPISDEEDALANEPTSELLEGPDEELAEEPTEELAEEPDEEPDEEESWVGAMKRGDGAREALDAEPPAVPGQAAPRDDRIMNMLSRVSPFGPGAAASSMVEGEFEVVGVDHEISLSSLCDVFGSSDDDVLSSLDVLGIHGDISQDEDAQLEVEEVEESVEIEEDAAEEELEAPAAEVSEEVVEVAEAPEVVADVEEVAEADAEVEVEEEVAEEAEVVETAEEVTEEELEAPAAEVSEEVEAEEEFEGVGSLDEASRAEEVIRELAAVRGVGDVRAAQMHRELGLTKVSDIIEAGSRGELRMLKGVGPKTETAMIEAAREALGDSEPESESSDEDPAEEQQALSAPPNFALVDDTNPRFADILERARARANESDLNEEPLDAESEVSLEGEVDDDEVLDAFGVTEAPVVEPVAEPEEEPEEEPVVEEAEGAEGVVAEVAEAPVVEEAADELVEDEEVEDLGDVASLDPPESEVVEELGSEDSELRAPIALLGFEGPMTSPRIVAPAILVSARVYAALNARVAARLAHEPDEEPDAPAVEDIVAAEEVVEAPAIEEVIEAEEDDAEIVESSEELVEQAEEEAEGDDLSGRDLLEEDLDFIEQLLDERERLERASSAELVRDEVTEGVESSRPLEGLSVSSLKIPGLTADEPVAREEFTLDLWTERSRPRFDKPEMGAADSDVLADASSAGQESESWDLEEISQVSPIGRIKPLRVAYFKSGKGGQLVDLSTDSVVDEVSEATDSASERSSSSFDAIFSSLGGGLEEESDMAELSAMSARRRRHEKIHGISSDFQVSNEITAIGVNALEEAANAPARSFTELKRLEQESLESAEQPEGARMLKAAKRVPAEEPAKEEEPGGAPQAKILKPTRRKRRRLQRVPESSSRRSRASSSRKRLLPNVSKKVVPNPDVVMTRNIDALSAREQLDTVRMPTLSNFGQERRALPADEHVNSEDEILRLYRDFVIVMHRCQVIERPIDFGKFSQRVSKQRHMAREKYGSNALVMEVKVSAGKPFISIKPRS